jgi:hypothetical protein
VEKKGQLFISFFLRTPHEAAGVLKKKLMPTCYRDGLALESMFDELKLSPVCSGLSRILAT